MSCDVPNYTENSTGLLSSERRLSVRFACTRLVVVRLPGPDGCWRWYWVANISQGGLAVSFLVEPSPQQVFETTLLDVDRALSFPVSLQFKWHRQETPTRTGFAFTRTEPQLLKWIASHEKERTPRGQRAQNEILWGQSES